mmetsp:Transcript_70673/g.212552  ORF Transcript_70673/g.212552 Transcript_70673/m.212552 type:complete len:190 (+) Transcript_70673:268-837(+)
MAMGSLDEETRAQEATHLPAPESSTLMAAVAPAVASEWLEEAVKAPDVQLPDGDSMKPKQPPSPNPILEIGRRASNVFGRADNSEPTRRQTMPVGLSRLQFPGGNNQVLEQVLAMQEQVLQTQARQTHELGMLSAQIENVNNTIATSIAEAIGKINEASHPMHYVKRANFTPNKAHSEMKQMEMEGGSP